ncbi:MAG: hypothetical protein AAGE84_10780 [Cyanobacteria bacterium P01_G01_bin.39]
MRQHFNDKSIYIKDIKRNCIKLILQGSDQGLKNIAESFESGELAPLLKEQFNLDIENAELIDSDSSEQKLLALTITTDVSQAYIDNLKTALIDNSNKNKEDKYNKIKQLDIGKNQKTKNSNIEDIKFKNTPITGNSQTISMNYINHYYQQGCILGQQAIQAEAWQNFPAAADLYDQAITQINYSINLAIQSGQFVPDYPYYASSFSYFRAALVKAALNFREVAQSYLTYALNLINQAIARNPNFFQYHSLAGEILLTQGNTIEAERAFLFAIQLNPMDARSNWMLGFLYSTRQQTAAANQYYQQAHRVEPNTPPIPSTINNTSNLNWLDIRTELRTLIKDLSPVSVNIYNNSNLYATSDRNVHIARGNYNENIQGSYYGQSGDNNTM